MYYILYPKLYQSDTYVRLYILYMICMHVY